MKKKSFSKEKIQLKWKSSPRMTAKVLQAEEQQF